MKTIPISGHGYASNCWLVTGDDGGDALLFDPSADAATILQTAGSVGSCIRGIVLTHGHFDHILCLDPLRAETGAPVMIHAYDAGCLTDASQSEFLSFLGKNVTFAPADRLLADGDELTVGGETVRVLHTPGHTPGSCCFLYGHSMITGDTLFDGAVGRTDLSGGSEEAMQQSLRRLAALPDDYRLYPGHGGVSTLQEQKAHNPYLRGAIDVEL